MIITKLADNGIGNQMFQYAVGRYLSTIHDTTLLLDISDCMSKPNKYSLCSLNVREEFASKKDIYKALHFNEKHFHFDSTILELSDGVHLSGYWQSEKYFINIEEIIRKELSVKNKISDKNKEIANQMALKNSVSLHIRRGDYLFKSIEILEPMILEYYYRCVDKVIKTVNNPHFFIFSDDIEWVRENLKLSYPYTVIAHNGANKDYEDLRLMSLCKHNIIANSSFSWWAAWLNRNPDKIVFSPKKWFSPKTKNINSKDLIPSSWFKI